MKWALSIGGALAAGAAVVVALGGNRSASKPHSGPKRVRRPALAGAWYPSAPERLARQVDLLLREAKARPIPPGRPAFLIQPHAGYVYSGRAAAVGLKSIGRRNFERIIILAPSHRAAFTGASIADVTHYATPLGEVPLDAAVCTALLKHPEIKTVPGAHAAEHSIEIQLPLLQWAMGRHPPAAKFRKGEAVEVPFRIVPVLFGRCTGRQLDAIAAALKPFLGPRTLLVASSDFTHYGANFGFVPFQDDIKSNLARLDGDAVKRILAKDTAGFERYLARTGATICGRGPIRVMLRLLPREAAGKQLAYYTSGDVTGVWSSSVSYVSLVFCVPEAKGMEEGLNQAEQDALLKLARATLERFVREGKRTDPARAGITLTDRLKEKRGAFVTLKRGDRLRGCIGYIVGLEPLYQTVIDNTINAASRDPRFPPVAPAELSDIHIEISVMSPLERVDDPETIEVGRHGLLIRQGVFQGVLLPQVATEQGWNREEFLEGVSRKAGLPPNAWRKAELFRFTAQVFGED